MELIIRPAIPDDTRECMVLRGKTRENAFSIEALAAIGITFDTWRDGICHGTSPGYVCEHNTSIVGMCFSDKATGEILVVAVLPEFEGRGIGKMLLNAMIEDLKLFGHSGSFLGCNPSSSSRSHGFYRRLGWTSTGKFDSYGDEILEIRFAESSTNDTIQLFNPPD